MAIINGQFQRTADLSGQAPDCWTFANPSSPPKGYPWFSYKSAAAATEALKNWQDGESKTNRFFGISDHDYSDCVAPVAYFEPKKSKSDAANVLVSRAIDNWSSRAKAATIDLIASRLPIVATYQKVSEFHGQGQDALGALSDIKQGNSTDSIFKAAAKLAPDYMSAVRDAREKVNDLRRRVDESPAMDRNMNELRSAMEEASRPVESAYSIASRSPLLASLGAPWATSGFGDPHNGLEVRNSESSFGYRFPVRTEQIHQLVNWYPRAIRLKVTNEYVSGILTLEPGEESPIFKGSFTFQRI